MPKPTVIGPITVSIILMGIITASSDNLEVMSTVLNISTSYSDNLEVTSDTFAYLSTSLSDNLEASKIPLHICVFFTRFLCISEWEGMKDKACNIN